MTTPRESSSLPVLVLLLGFWIWGCGGGSGTASDGAGSEVAVVPRITAEHPATSQAAVEAGIWGEGEAGAPGPGEDAESAPELTEASEEESGEESGDRETVPADAGAGPGELALRGNLSEGDPPLANR